MVSFPKLRIEAVGALGLLGTALFAFGQAPFTAATAKLHEIGLAHHKRDFVLVQWSVFRVVEVWNRVAFCVRLVEIIETVHIASGVRLRRERGGTLAVAAVAGVRRNLADVLNVLDAPGLPGRVSRRRVQLQCFVELGPELALQVRNVGVVAHLFQIAVLLHVLVLQVQERVEGLRSESHSLQRRNDASFAEHAPRIVGNGDAIHGGSPATSVRHLGDREWGQRNHARLHFLRSGCVVVAARRLCNVLGIGESGCQRLGPEAARFTDNATEEAVRGRGDDTCDLCQTSTAGLAMDRDAGRVSAKVLNLALHPAKRSLDVHDAEVPSRLLGVDVSLERHPADRARAVVHVDGNDVVERGESTHVVRFRLAKLVGAAVDVDHHRLEVVALLRGGRLPHIELEAVFGAVVGGVREDLETRSTPHGCVEG
mmetsp:Transcript_46373/g.68456  ORF Transcript_46373/g.68456 Transcript_46373/m.68456 type:complete len:426 (-) Transcript_46373:303-1580(-)